MTKTKRQIADEVEAWGHPRVNCNDRIEVFMDGTSVQARVESHGYGFVPSIDGGYTPIDVIIGQRRQRVKWNRDLYRWECVN